MYHTMAVLLAPCSLCVVSYLNLAQLGGIQTYITTMIVGYVLLNFIIMALRIQRK